MRTLVAGLTAVVILGSGVSGPHSSVLQAAGDPPHGSLSVRITSPLGRTGQPGAVRIVAHVSHPSNVALSSVKFYVNDVLAGNRAGDPPYAVEWTDANPFEPTRIRVEANDALGNSAADAIELAPFEIVEETGVSRVLLEATVTDKGDRFVNGLTADSFRVLENDEPQSIDLVTVESLPVTYILLVDASQSMHPRMDFVRAAAGRLADFLRPADRVIVAPFAKSLGPITGPTADHETIAGAIQAIAAKGGTAISDGLIAASRLVTGTDRRHVIVLVTDGYDENSQSKIDEALVAAQASHAAVYVIGIGGIAGISLKGERALRKIAAQTGGRVFFPSRERELPSVHELVAADVQQRYLITYSPSNQTADGAWRRIAVSTTDMSDRVRTRAGYFAPAPPPVRPSLEFTITSGAHEYPDLTRDDLVVTEDGVAQKVDVFQEAVAPLSIVLALDASGSMARAAESVKAAALSFVDALRPEDALSVLLFSDTAAFAHDLTTNRKQTRSAIEGYAARGGTALYDALTDALMRLKKAEGRKVIVLLSDGRDEDNPGTGPGSARTKNDVFATLTDVDAMIYPIGLGPRVDRALLEKLAAESGAIAFFPEDVSTLRADYARVIEDLRRRYVVSYTSTNPARDGGWRQVQIQARQPEITVRGRSGYFAPER
ncbi:MAG TPA: VWA domain-containing protein [Vicinamibacterales bacterium]|nr:VWA domain-containing protein [Vicinamibacterales bacterium]